MPMPAANPCYAKNGIPRASGLLPSCLVGCMGARTGRNSASLGAVASTIVRCRADTLGAVARIMLDCPAWCKPMGLVRRVARPAWC